MQVFLLCGVPLCLFHCAPWQTKWKTAAGIASSEHIIKEGSVLLVAAPLPGYFSNREKKHMHTGLHTRIVAIQWLAIDDVECCFGRSYISYIQMGS